MVRNSLGRDPFRKRGRNRGVGAGPCARPTSRAPVCYGGGRHGDLPLQDAAFPKRATPKTSSARRRHPCQRSDLPRGRRRPTERRQARRFAARCNRPITRSCRETPPAFFFGDRHREEAGICLRSLLAALYYTPVLCQAQHATACQAHKPAGQKACRAEGQRLGRGRPGGGWKEQVSFCRMSRKHLLGFASPQEARHLGPHTRETVFASS